jgi:hypothetical protein
VATAGNRPQFLGATTVTATSIALLRRWKAGGPAAAFVIDRYSSALVVDELEREDGDEHQHAHDDLRDDTSSGRARAA